jgi:hypothetical protein
MRLLWQVAVGSLHLGSLLPFTFFSKQYIFTKLVILPKILVHVKFNYPGYRALTYIGAIYDGPEL